MNILIVLGLILGGGTTAVDRLVRRLPNRAAIVLYVIAVILIIAGMIMSRRAGR